MNDSCFHCGLPVMAGDLFTLEIDGKLEKMCCPGCQAVAQTIIDGGLGNYYQFRSQVAEQAQNSDALSALSIYDDGAFQDDFVNEQADGSLQAQLQIEGISCAACIWLIEKHLESIEGIKQVSVNLNLHRAFIQWDPQACKLSDIVKALHFIGYQTAPYQACANETLIQNENRSALRRLGIAGIGMMQVGMYALALHAGALQGMDENIQHFLRWFSLIVCTPVVFYSARSFFEAAWRSIKTRHPTMDLSVSIAIGIAYISSAWATVFNHGEVYFDSVVMFTFFLLLGRYLEMRARHSYNRSNTKLSTLLPPAVCKVLAPEKADSETRTVALKEIQLGDVLRVLPGEIIPADGTVCSGESSIDESAFTGEYLPIKRRSGDKVSAGTINIESPIDVCVSALSKQSQLSAVIQLLERAQQDKPAIARIADQVSGYFVSLVLLVALIVASSWYLIDPSQAFWITLSVLVVSCPCALSLATPTALTIATTSLREKGLLISRADVFETLPKIDHVIFDKTGTLTEGKLSLSETRPLSNIDVTTIHQLAKTLESRSEHPIARCLKNLKVDTLAIDKLRQQTGKGISACIEGKQYFIGSRAFISDVLDSDVLDSDVLDSDTHGNNSQTDDNESNTTFPSDASSGQSIYLAGEVEQKITLLAQLVFDDAIRPSAFELVNKLKQQGYKITLLSGDSSAAGPLTATALGIKNVITNASPQQKLQVIEQCQSEGERVLVIGDGVNDAPVLARADVSIAMSNATDLTKASADCVLISPKLTLITEVLEKAGKTRRIIWQNIAWSLGYNLTTIPLASFGLIPPYLAAIGMSSSSLVVVINALRLK
jgi:Cu2+-exporting ATPase